jgi:hypothetical protein
MLQAKIHHTGANAAAVAKVMARTMERSMFRFGLGRKFNWEDREIGASACQMSIAGVTSFGGRISDREYFILH